MMLAVLAVPTNTLGIDELRKWLFRKSIGLNKAVTIGEAIESWGQACHFATFGKQTLLFDDWWIGEGFLGHLQEPRNLQSLLFSSGSLFLMLDGANGQCENFDFARIAERTVIRRWTGRTSSNECISWGPRLLEEQRVLKRLEAQLNKPGLQQFWDSYPQNFPVMRYPDSHDDSEIDAFVEAYFERCDSIPLPPRSPEGNTILTSLVRPLILGLLSECLEADCGGVDFLSAPAYPLDGPRY